MTHIGVTRSTKRQHRKRNIPSKTQATTTINFVKSQFFRLKILERDLTTRLHKRKQSKQYRPSRLAEKKNSFLSRAGSFSTGHNRKFSEPEKELKRYFGAACSLSTTKSILKSPSLTTHYCDEELAGNVGFFWKCRTTDGPIGTLSFDANEEHKFQLRTTIFQT